jgi:hypothetical protein
MIAKSLVSREFDVLGPERHEPPAHYVQAALAGPGIKADHRKRVGWRHVPTRRDVRGGAMRIGHRLRKVLLGRVSLLIAGVLTVASLVPQSGASAATLLALQSGGGTAFELTP